uniref:Uncharacterized protein n=1 Tax=Hemiselmis andersenii TaxID=464988 RepID=A0A6U4VSC3_HEMAN
MEEGDLARRGLLGLGALGGIILVDTQFEEWVEGWEDASDELKDEDVKPLITFPNFPGMNQGGDELEDPGDDGDDKKLIDGVGKVVGGTVSAVSTVAPMVWKGVEIGVNDVVVPTAKFTADVVIPEAKKAADVLVPGAQKLAKETSTTLKPLVDEAIKEAAPIVEPALDSAKQQISNTIDTVVKPAVSGAGTNLENTLAPTLQVVQKAVSDGVSTASELEDDIQNIAEATGRAVEPALPVLRVAGGAAAGIAKGTISVASSAVESYQEGGGQEIVKDAVQATAATATPVLREVWSLAVEWVPVGLAKAKAVGGEAWNWATVKWPVVWDQLRSKAATPSPDWKPPVL